VEYLKTPPDLATLKRIVAATGEPVRALLRERGTPYAELGLDDANWTDEQLLGFILQHPILMNRPVVVPPFIKEDGEPVVDTGVRLNKAA